MRNRKGEFDIANAMVLLGALTISLMAVSFWKEPCSQPAPVTTTQVKLGPLTITRITPAGPGK